MPTQTSTIRTYLIAYLPALSWASLIFILSSFSSLPGFSVSALDFILKKTAHMGSFGFLFFLLFLAQRKTHPNQSITKAWQIPLLISFIYAVSDEIHQSFVPGRIATIRDVGYDILGSFIAMLKIYRYI